MPTGAPTRVATTVIMMLPAIGLSSPPWLPGGGVILAKRSGPIAASPLRSRA